MVLAAPHGLSGVGLSPAAETGAGSPAPRSHSSGWGTIAVWGQYVCLPSQREWLHFLPPVIVTICFPPSCLLMFSCFKTEMSQIGSEFRKKCLGGKLKVAVGGLCFRAKEEKKILWGRQGHLPGSPALWRMEPPVAQAGGFCGFVRVCEGTHMGLVCR